MMKFFLFLVVLSVIGIWNVSTHPVSTFNFVITDSKGNIGMGANITAGVNTTVYYILQDQLNNLTLVQFGDLMMMHERWMHLLIVSSDFAHALHTHPDFLDDLADAPANKTIFSFRTPFPISGPFTIGAQFLFVDNRLGTMREGFSDCEIIVYGTPLPDYNRVFNYTISNRFTTYPIASNDEFDVWVDVDTNLDWDNGFYGELIVGQGTADSNSPVMYAGPNNFNSSINYCGNNCTWFYLTIYSNISKDSPANMIPYLAAPVHFTISAEDGAVYHAHGTYVPPGMKFPEIVQEMGQLTMDELMDAQMSNASLFNLSMNALMIGVTMDNSIDCLTDEGTLMMSMGSMMDMNQFYGPKTFGTVAGIFNWPDGGGLYNLFAYMKVLLPNGEERLIVPHFSIQVEAISDVVITPPFNGTLSGGDEAMSSASQLFGSVIAIFLLLSTLVFF